MTNAQIINNARLALAADGKLELVDGLPEEIHTYNKWKQMGYQVFRGEKAVCKLSIWKPVSKKKAGDADGDEDQKKDDVYMVMKTAFFFSTKQVYKLDDDD